MPITLLSATVTAPNTVRLSFSEPFIADSDFYLPNNYAIVTRYGDDVPLYAKTIAVYSASVATISLRDAMLSGGQYRITLQTVKGVDGIRIEAGPGPNYADFLGVGDPLGVFSLRKRVPAWWDTKYDSNFYGVLGAVGHALDQAGGKSGSAVKEAVDAIMIRTATGADLDVIGQNYGVVRPDFALSDDALFRPLIPLLAADRKAVLKVFYGALTDIIGDQATYGWRIYTFRPEELTIELPADVYFGLGAGNLASSTYFHTDATDTYPPSYPGDYFLADASIAGTDIAGNTIQLFQRTVIEDIASLIKAAGIKIDVVTI